LQVASTTLFRYALLRRLRIFILGPAGPFFLSAEFREHFYTDQSKKDKVLLGIGYSIAIIRQLALLWCAEIGLKAACLGLLHTPILPSALGRPCSNILDKDADTDSHLELRA
jgi:hypothetical protein